MSIKRVINPRTKVTRDISPKCSLSKNRVRTEILRIPHTASVTVAIVVHFNPLIILDRKLMVLNYILNKKIVQGFRVEGLMLIEEKKF